MAWIAIPHQQPGRLRFVVPSEPLPIAAALVDRFAYIDACPIVDPDRRRMTAWLKERRGTPIEAAFEPADALEDLEVCMDSLARSGRIAGGYVVCDGAGEILWRPILRRIVDPDDTSATMRMAGLPDTSIGLAQAMLGRLAIA